jgi:hypothetical protein
MGHTNINKTLIIEVLNFLPSHCRPTLSNACLKTSAESDSYLYRHAPYYEVVSHVVFRENTTHISEPSWEPSEGTSNSLLF